MADYGAAVLEQLTAFGHEPGGEPALMPLAGNDTAGAPSLELLTATGVQAPTGLAEPSLSQLTATAYDPWAEPGGAFAQLTATGVSENAWATGSATLEPATATGEHSFTNVAAGDVLLEGLGCAAYGPFEAAGTFEALTADGLSIASTDGAGAATFVALTAAATATGTSDAQGTCVLQPLTSSGVAYVSGPNAGAGVLRALQAQGSAVGGTNGVAAVTFEEMEVDAYGAPQSVAAGAARLPYIAAYGIAEPALTTTLNTLVMNVSNQAVTRYPSYPANSFASYNGTYLGAGPNGLMQLQGADTVDYGGDGIDWTVRTGAMDDGEPALKRMTELVFGLRASAAVNAKVWTNDTHSYGYTVQCHQPGKLLQVRVQPGKGLRSRYYKVELGAVGVRLELDSLQATMPVTTRRLG